MINILKKRLSSKQGQQAMESILIFVAVVVVMIFALSQNGFFTNAVDESLDQTMRGADITLKGRVCFSDSVEGAWEFGNWSECANNDDIRYRELVCPSGCCVMPPPTPPSEECGPIIRPPPPPPPPPEEEIRELLQ